MAVRSSSSQIAIIGGGAAGFFAALRLKSLQSNLEVVIYEKTAKLLQKVRISGGGRCNVTHACFEPKALTGYYPRGHKELRGPFHHFQPGDMIGWLEDRGIAVKTEADGRMFPESDQSQTIIDCFLEEGRKLGVAIRTQYGLESLVKDKDGSWRLSFRNQQQERADAVLIAAGGDRNIWALMESLGVKRQAVVPSLFTFRTPQSGLHHLAGVSTPVRLKIPEARLEDAGPLLITHRGFSGPSILRLSAWGAYALAEQQYRFTLKVNWADAEADEVQAWMDEQRQMRGKKQVHNTPWPGMPRRLWQALIEAIPNTDCVWAELKARQADAMVQKLTADDIQVTGKDTNKEEFVTAGGIHRKAIDFRTMAVKQQEGLFAAGEVIDIDALTGGFNFQAAWTGAWLAAEGVIHYLDASYQPKNSIDLPNST